MTTPTTVAGTWVVQPSDDGGTPLILNGSRVVSVVVILSHSHCHTTEGQSPKRKGSLQPGRKVIRKVYLVCLDSNKCVSKINQIRGNEFGEIQGDFRNEFRSNQESCLVFQYFLITPAYRLKDVHLNHLVQDVGFSLKLNNREEVEREKGEKEKGGKGERERESYANYCQFHLCALFL